MAKLIFGMNVSLDGFVDHEQFAPEPSLFRHWIEHVRGLAGSVYGRRMYETMRYFDDDHPEWTDEQHEFADAWRRLPKWVASNTMLSVGPNATLLKGNVGPEITKLKSELEGEISVSGPELAASVADLIDEYRLYYHPVAIGSGKSFFAGLRRPLRLISSERIGESTVILTYVPA